MSAAFFLSFWNKSQFDYDFDYWYSIKFVTTLLWKRLSLIDLLDVFFLGELPLF